MNWTSTTKASTLTTSSAIAVSSTAWSPSYALSACAWKKLCMTSSKKRKADSEWKPWTSNMESSPKTCLTMQSRSNDTVNSIYAFKVYLSNMWQIFSLGTVKFWHNRTTYRGATLFTLLRWINSQRAKGPLRRYWISILIGARDLTSSCIYSFSYKALSRAKNASIRERATTFWKSSSNSCILKTSIKFAMSLKLKRSSC